MKPIPDFPEHPTCEACELHATCQSRGIPTRLADHPDCGIDCYQCEKAVLFIGEAPGYDEDQEAASWIGWAGELLHSLIGPVFHLNDLADIYLSNAVRCRPPGNATPLRGHMNACRRHLLEDIRWLLDEYGEDNLTIVCLGAPATWTISGQTIKKSLPYQGVPVVPKSYKPPKLPKGSTDSQKNLGLPAIPVFYTYHPAALSPGRSPHLIEPVSAHLKLLVEHLSGTRQASQELPEIIRAPILVGYRASVVSLDIETYGILKRYEQTVFHPVRANVVDKIPRNRMVVCCALAWHCDMPYMPYYGEHVAFYNLYDSFEMSKFIKALRGLKDVTLVGQNLPFDLNFLRFTFPELRMVLRSDRFKLDDTTILNHLHGDLRPERSLKAVSHLFNTANYHALAVSTLPTGQSAISPEDPNLAHYNCTDAISTLRLYYKFTRELAEKWGPEAPGIDRVAFRSDLLWTILHMSEAGLRFDMAGLAGLRETLEAHANAAYLFAKDQGFLLEGKGSAKSKRQLITNALRETVVEGDNYELLDDNRVEFTQKRHDISTGKNNVNLLLSEMPAGAHYRSVIQAMSDHAKAFSILRSYVKPLLKQPAKGCLPNGAAYPSWFPVPAYVKDEAGDTGGTKQGRFAAHNPGAQTFPPSIDEHYVSRYEGGYLLGFDVAQAELRMAALLSGDPAMIQMFQEDRDPHGELAKLIWPDFVRDDSDPVLYERRQVARNLNFLINYRGGPKALLAKLRTEVGIELPFAEALRLIPLVWKGRQGLWEWQEGLIRLVGEQGYLELLTGWRRTFVRDAATIQETFVNEICNFGIQTYTAQVVQSAQAAWLQARRKHGVTFCMPSNNHDNIMIDCPCEAYEPVQQLAPGIMTRPPLWDALCDYYERDVPLKYEMKVLWSPDRGSNHNKM